MATPTRAELETQLKAIIDIAEETRKFGEANSQNFVSLQDTLVQALESDHSGRIMSGVSSARQGLSKVTSSMRSSFQGHLLDWARFLNTRATDPQDILSEMYVDFIDNSKTVKTRAFTFGAAATGGGFVGDGNLYRVTADAQGHDIEAVTPEIKRVECIADQNSGTDKNEERFLLTGTDRGDDVELQGSGAALTIATTASTELNRFLQNPSFESVDLSGGSIDGWTSDVTINATNYTSLSSADAAANSYLPPKDNRASSARKSLQLDTDVVLTQQINRRRVALPETPLFFRLAYNRDLDTSTASGTLTVAVGAISRAVTVSGSGWQEVLVPASLGQSNWLQAQNENDFDVQLTWAADSGSGGLVIDDIELVAMTEFDGSWWAIAPGRTPFMSRTSTRTRGDFWTVTDTATDSVIQRWLWRWFGAYLPHAGSPTITDP